jgi:hypothetical protein
VVDFSFSLVSSILPVSRYTPPFLVFFNSECVAAADFPPPNFDLPLSSMRRTSVSLPTNKIAHDPHEKPARYGAHPRRAGLLGKLSAWMSAAKQTRWVKAAAVLLTVFFVFYYFSPSGVDLYRGGKQFASDLTQVKTQNAH